MNEPKARIMSIVSRFPAALLETILFPLASILLAAADDRDAARLVAIETLESYDPQNAEELRLVAKLVCFSLQSMQALGQAAGADLPLTRVLRLRGGAISLTRAAERAQRRLQALRQARRDGVPPKASTQVVQPEAAAERAVVLMEDTRKVAAAAKANGLTWSQAYKQRQQDLRRAARQARAAQGRGSQGKAPPVQAPAAKASPPQASRVLAPPVHGTSPMRVTPAGLLPGVQCPVV